MNTLVEEFMNEKGKVYGDSEYLVVQVNRANENDDDPDYSADIFRKDQLLYAVGKWMSWGPNDIDTCEIYKVSEDEYNRSDDIKNFIADKEPIITFDGIDACDLINDYITKYHPDIDEFGYYELDSADRREFVRSRLVKQYIYRSFANVGIKLYKTV